MWSWILKAVVAVSKNPAVRAWVEKKALEIIAKLRAKAEAKAAAVAASASIPVPPHPGV
jgi:hypothetical protein